MEPPVETYEEYRGHNIDLMPDMDPFNPREEFDQLATIAYKHREYELGEEKIDDPINWLCDKLGKEHILDKDNDKLKELEEEFMDKYYALPLFLLNHSGITISTKPFSCPWDSGKVGYVYVSKEEVERQKVPKEEVYDILDNEIKEFDTYVRGDVYVVSVQSPDGAVIDSLGGVPIDGPEDERFQEVVSEMKAAVDHELKNEEEYENMC